MKKTKIFSLFVLLVSVLACCCFVGNKNFSSAYALETTQEECFSLIDDKGNLYTADVSVGTVEGMGKFIIGADNVVLKATAKDEFKLVGWRITYLEQENRVEFIDTNDLDEGSKLIEMTAKDNVTKTTATVEFFSKDNVIQSSNFKIESVFENLKVTPVFDHVYYFVEINKITNVATLNNSLAIGANTLYYETSSVDNEVTKYENAYIKIGTEYFYYGDLFYNGNKYYTLHDALNAEQPQVEVEYLSGAFRVGENVSFDLNVDIVDADLYNSKNIDLINSSVVGNSTLNLEKNTTDEEVVNSFKITQDSYLRTTNIAFDFNVIASRNQRNSIDIVYHNLYVADIDILIDGRSDHGEESDVFGNTTVKANEILSNISIYNFYSRTNENNQQFLIKKAQDNATKSFTVVCANSIGKTIDEVSYRYYSFVSLDGLNNQSQYYSNVSQNIEIVIEYSSIKFEIDFLCAEYIEDAQGNGILTLMEGEVLDAVLKKRGEILSLTSADLVDVNNVGYEFVGFAFDLTDEVESSIEYQIDRNKPEGTTIYLCFKKIEYEIVFADYNKIEINGAKPLNSISFTINDGAKDKVQTINQVDLVGQTFTLTEKIKINSTISISHILNQGFLINGYSLKDPTINTDEDYFTTLTLNSALIEEFGLTDKIIIYVYEDFIKYTLTYFINPTHDNNLDADVIMADLTVENDGETIERYDMENNLICEENNNMTALVAKIVVADLKFNSQVTLKSKPRTGNDGEDDYLYVFNWFTEDDKSTLSYVKDGEFYNHIETITRDRAIKVVYSMPSTKILVTIEEEFSQNANFNFEFSITENGEQLSPELGNDYLYSVEVGVDLVVTVDALAFGYDFLGYTYVEDDEYVAVSNFTFNYVSKVGVNTLLLDFERIEYHFIFSQYGAEKEGDKVLFEGKDFAVLDVDHTSLEIIKPLGYYVSRVNFNEIYNEYSAQLSEDNTYRSNANIQTYNFNLIREDFINIVTNYAVLNNQSIAEINVKLDYEIFNYQIRVDFGISNPKGDTRDSYVNYPNMQLRYVVFGRDFVAPIDASYGTNTVVFINIPYGAQATLSLLNSAPAGFSLSGWYYADGKMILQEDYAHSLDHLVINEVNNDKTFVYKISYNAYQVNVVYVSGQGSPLTYINNNLITSERKQITLYDRLDIDANASRNNGYIFDKITYLVPNYSLYSYDEENWSSTYDKLYIYRNGQYHINNSVDYDMSTDYYILTKQEVEWLDSVFTDEMFLVSNYALQDDGKTITFNVQYKLLELSIVNSISQKGKTPMWTLTGRGSGNAKVEINLNDFALISTTAKYQEEEERDVLAGDVVYFYDTIKLSIQINKKAINNFNQTEFDLTNGLILNSVKIAGKSVGFAEKTKGLYELTFYVGEYLPTEGEIINISYEFRIQEKTLKVTTIVKSSTEFYKNIKLYANAEMYDFETATLVTENNASELTHGFQFLAKVRVYASFVGANYSSNFEIAGVRVYCDGTAVLVDDYSNKGIVVNEDVSLDVRMMSNVEVEFVVQPKITFNKGPVYTKSFKCDNQGNGENQQLSVGSTDDYDIQIAEMLVGCVSLKYISTEPNSVYVDSVKTVGRYNVSISFVNSGEYDWLNEVQIAESVVLIIQPKEIYLAYDQGLIVPVNKVYDGSSGYNILEVYKYLRYTDNQFLNIPYSTIIASATNNLALTNSIECYVSSLGKDAAVTEANENIYYNLYIYNFALKETAFNSNFVLKNSDLIIYNFIKITKRKLQLLNVAIYDKVYDGTDKAELVPNQNVRLSNWVEGDDVSVDLTKLNPKFTDFSVGTNKNVKIDIVSALTGKDVQNYYIDEIQLDGLTIYPYSLSTTVNGVGKIEITNRRGLTEKDKVTLIPLNATLSVQPIYEGSNIYVSIYGRINKYLKGNNEFAIGYTISFLINGENVAVDNNLYLSIPYVKNSTGTYYLTGHKTGNLSYNVESGYMIIDLNQMDSKVDRVFITKVKYLLKAWQIVLIVIGGILVITGVVITFIILRKRKVDRDSVHEKI